MKNEFIPYEQALELKELGFDEPCFMFYEQGTKNKHLQQGIDSDYWGDYSGARDWNSMLNKPYKPFCKCISAPLYQQAFRFFRENHNLHHEIEYNGYEYVGYVSGMTANIFKTYEEAELACLKKLIEIAKNN